MSELTKQALKVENNQSFPNNNAGLITPSALRTFNEDMIDSTVNQASYTADSASFNSRINAITGSGGSVNTGSLLLTASFDNNTRNLTFTKGDSSTFAVNIPDASGSILPSGVVSGSSQIDYPFISNIPSGIVSGSGQVSYTGLSNIPSGIVSGAAQVTPLLPSGVVSGSSQVSYTGLSNIPAGIVSGSSQIILQDTTGLLSGSRIDGAVTSSLTSSLANQALDVVVNVKNSTGTQINKGTIVRIIGATGDNPLIQTASWENDGSSANTLGWVLANIPNGDFGKVVTQGTLLGVNTDPALGYTAGQVLYLSSSGQYTNVIPPAPYHEVRLGQVLRAQQNNGSVFVQVQNGYELSELHDVNITTSSLANNNVLAYNSTSGQWVNQTPSGLGVAMTGSNNTFSGTQTFNNIVVNGTASLAYLQTVTGSAKIIGDAFIILNNDTPTERYAGIIVLDSGSAGTSASFQFDGLTNDWFYEYTGSDPLNFGVAMFGPEYGTKGSPTYLTNNRLPKGDGGHHLNDSNISDDGSNVSINSNTQITGSLLINGNAPLINSDLTSLNNFTTSIQAEVDNLQSVTGSYATTGSNTFVGNQLISGSTTITSNLNITPVIAPNTPPGGFAQFVIPFLSGSNFTFARDADNALFWSPFFNQLGVSSSAANTAITPGNFSATNSSGNNSIFSPTRVSNRSVVGKLIGISADPSLTALPGATTTNPSIILESGSAGVTEYYTPIQFESSQSFTDGRVTITRPLIGLQGAEITGSVTISGSTEFDLTVQGRQLITGPTTGETPQLLISGSDFSNRIGRSSVVISGTNNATASLLPQALSITTGTNNAGLIQILGTINGQYFGQSFGGNVGTLKVSDLTEIGFALDGAQWTTNWGNGPIIYVNNTPGDTYEGVFGFQDKTNYTDGRITALKRLDVSGSVNIQSTLTASLQQGYVWVGDANGRTTTIATSSLSSVPFPFTGSAQITGSLGITGSMSGFVNTLGVSSNTASVNFNDGNMFVITLTGGATTHFTPSNIKAGQTINIQISQPSGASTGSVSFSPNVLFAGGNDYQVTATGSAIDLLTFVSLDGTNVLGTSIKNFL